MSDKYVLEILKIKHKSSKIQTLNLKFKKKTKMFKNWTIKFKNWTHLLAYNSKFGQKSLKVELKYQKLK